MPRDKKPSVEVILDLAVEAYGKLLAELGGKLTMKDLRAIAKGADVFDIRAANIKVESDTLVQKIAKLRELLDEKHLADTAELTLKSRIELLLHERIDGMHRNELKLFIKKERTSTPVDRQLLRECIASVAGAGDKLLFAGLAVLVPDAEDFCDKHAVNAEDLLPEGDTGKKRKRASRESETSPQLLREHAAMLFEVVKKVSVTKKKIELTKAGGKRTVSVTMSNQTTEVTRRAYRGDVNVEPLLVQDTKDKLLVAKGRMYFKEFMKRLTENICGPDGPYEQLKKGLDRVHSKLPENVAAWILATSFSTSTLWYPLAAYLAVLLVRTGLDVVCEA